MPYQAPTFVHKVFSKEEYADFERYVRFNVKFINSKLQNFREAKLPELVKLYKGVPKTPTVDFPWPGAANLVIQLIGTFCDELLSRVMGGIYLYDPLFEIALSGESADKKAEDMKAYLQRFLTDEAYDPNALDLYRNEQALFSSAIKYGTGIIELPWEYNIEKQYTSIPGIVSPKDKTYNFQDYVKRDSPHPKFIPLNKFGIDPRVANLEDAEFFYTIDTLNYVQMLNLPDRNDLYRENKKTIEEVRGMPDRLEQGEMQQALAEALGLESSSERGSAEWDIYNCYIKYRKGSETYSIHAKYHSKSQKIIYAIFNPYPKNIHPVEDAKLSYDDESYFGTGYAQMLRAYQKEISQNVNWRTNNRNFSMMGILRVDPESKLSSILQVYPGVMVPAQQGAVELLKAGSDVGYSNEADNFIYSCAKDRAGVDPAITGLGGGIVNPKRGIYSASGTSMMLMQQNNRNNLRMSDMRSAHVRIAIKLMEMYSNIGIEAKLRKYGTGADILKAALNAYKEGSLGFRLRPTNASNNKELERQNDVLLSGALERYYQQNAQLIQAIMQMNEPQQEPLKQYYISMLLSNKALYKSILRNFNHEDSSRLLPDLPNFNQAGPGGGNQNVQGSGSNTGAGQNKSVVPIGGFQMPQEVPA